MVKIKSLKGRLSLLRQQAGAIKGERVTPDPTLSEPFNIHSSQPPVKGIADSQLAELIQGDVIAPGLVLRESRCPLNGKHGSQPLGDVFSLACPDMFAVDGFAQDRLVFLDTETTGLSGGSGTVVFLLALGFIEPAHFRVKQYFMNGFRGEKTMLSLAVEDIINVDTVVSYNGKAFDLPLLATRYRLQRLACSFSQLQHIDLLYFTRKAFRKRWPDCRLQTAEQQLLAFYRQDDLPGWLIPEVWQALVQQGVVAQIPALTKHNELDLVSLLALIPALSAVFNPTSTEFMRANLLGVARHWYRLGKLHKAIDTLAAHEALLDITSSLELATLYRRQNEWNAAVAIWQRLVVKNNTDAMMCLAKYYEHVIKDLPMALDLTQQLICQDQLRMAEHRHRQQRLMRRLAMGTQ